MIQILIILQLLQAFSIKSIPEGGSPPLASSSSAAVYDTTTNCIITIGGHHFGSNQASSEVHIFNLSSKTWSSPQINSEYSPSSLVNHRMILKGRKCIIFGKHSEVFLFDVESSTWSKDTLKGDQLNGVETFAFDYFRYEDRDFVAIFGGIIGDTYVNGLYLIDVNTLECRKLEGNGPSPRMGSSLVFFQESLYVFGYSFQQVSFGKETGDELFKYDLRQGTWKIVETFGNKPEMRVSHYAYVHEMEMFIIYGIIPEYSFEHQSIFKYNFKNFTWKLVNDVKTTGRVFSADVKIGSKVYLFYGKNSTKTMNSAVFLDLSLESPIPIIISKDWISPNGRVHHASFIVNQYMFIFGGSDGAVLGTEKFFNDLWSFDLTLNQWKLVYATGDVPSARKNMAFTLMGGNTFIIFGGKSSEGYKNDFFMFHQGQVKWILFEVTGEKPEFRANSCITMGENKFYIVGGKNGEKGFGDIWIFDFLSNKYSSTSAKIQNVPNQTLTDINDAFCYVDLFEKMDVLSIVGGTNYIGYPNMGIMSIYFTKTSIFYYFQPFGNIHSLSMFGSETSILKVGDYLIRLSGAALSKLVLPNILIVNPRTSEVNLLKTNKSLDLFGHSAVHFKDFLLIFGGIGANEIYKSSDKLNKNLLLVKFGKEDSFELACSGGTDKKTCEPCLEGNFSFDGKCQKCPEGKFNNLIYSTSPELCLPCPKGFFNNKTGAKTCLECPSGFFCPIGSKSPKNFYSLPKNSSLQPFKLKSMKGFISDLNLRIWLLALMSVSFIAFLVIFIPMLWIKLKGFDLFSESHSQGLEIPVVYRKTSIGGFVSVLFIVVAGVLVSSGFIGYYLDNVSEIKALVPLMSLEEEVVADKVNVTATFYMYGGECAFEGNCSSKVSYQYFGFTYRKLIFSCRETEQNCDVIMTFQQFKLIDKEAEINIRITDLSGYSSAVSVNISSTSSIPDQISNIFTVFDTNSQEKLFRGSNPSIFSFKLIPSVIFKKVFFSESSEWPSKETGFHVSMNSDPIPGSMATQDTLNIFPTLNMKIVIIESETAMQTNRIINQKVFAFFGTIIGSVFGIMGSFAGFMKVWERFVKVFNDKLQEREKINRIIEKRNGFKEQFFPVEWNKRDSKVSPIKWKVTEPYEHE